MLRNLYFSAIRETIEEKTTRLELFFSRTVIGIISSGQFVAELHEDREGRRQYCRGENF